jgi:hypothetical protein
LDAGIQGRLRAKDVWLGTESRLRADAAAVQRERATGSLPAWLATVGARLPLTHGIQAAREVAAMPRSSMQVSDTFTLTYWQSCSSSHPLGVAVGDEPAAAVGVLVLEDPVEHVGDGLEAAVGCQGVPLGSPGA